MLRPKVLDLFAGCGGLSIGLEEAGFDVCWANELDPNASNTYRACHPSTRFWEEDVNLFLRRVIDGEKGTPLRGEVDLIAGGPPCQGFSGYNRYRSPNDIRNSLVDSYLAFIELLNPRFVLIENVPGMLQMDHGRVPLMILKTLEELGYNTRLGILQAGCYGVPQNRWRVFIIGSVKGTVLPKLPEPTFTFPRTTIFGVSQFRDYIVKPPNPGVTLFGEIFQNRSVGDAMRDLPKINNGGGFDEMEYVLPGIGDYQVKMREGAQTIFDHRSQNQGTIMLNRIMNIPKVPLAGWLDLPEDLKPKNLNKHGDGRYNNRFGRLWWDGIFNTIVTKPEPYWGRFIHPEEDRVISVRESARAQGIADRVRFFGTLPARYRQIGNAVPPPLAFALGNEFIRSLGYDPVREFM